MKCDCRPGKNLRLAPAGQSKLPSRETPGEKEGGDGEWRTPSGTSVPGFGAGERARSVLPWGASWETHQWVQGVRWEADLTCRLSAQLIGGTGTSFVQNGKCCIVSHMALDLESRWALGATLSMLVSAWLAAHGSVWVHVQFPAHPDPG